MSIVQVGGRKADSSILHAHLPTGLVGTDDAMLRELIADTPVGATAMLANGGDTPYAIDGVLEIRKNMRFGGRGVSYDCERVQPVGSTQPIDQPVSAPWLRGSVILQTQAGEDGISCPESGSTVDLFDMGVRFDDAIKFVDTGHAFSAVPDVAHEAGLDHGLISARWAGLMAYGHDGDHYGLRWVNPLLGHIDFPRCWGGGILQLEGISDLVEGYNYGNVTVMHPYGMLFVGGGAHGYSIKSNRAIAMGLVVFIRPQCNGALTSKYPQAAAIDVPNQCLFTATDGGFDNSVAIIGGKDFESGLVMPCRYGVNLRSYVEPGGISGNAGDPTSLLHRVAADSQSGSYIDSKLVRHGRTSPLPALASSAGNGSSGTAVLTNSSDDNHGVITLTPNGTGITNAYNNQGAVFTAGTPAAVLGLLLRPLNAAAALAGDLFAIPSGGTFLLRFQGNGTGALASGAAHTWSYVAVTD